MIYTAQNAISLVEVLREKIETLENDAHDLIMRDYNIEAIHVLERLIRLLDQRPEPEFQENLADAILQKGQQLSALERDEEAIETFDTIVTRFGNCTEPPLRLTVAEALSSSASCYGFLNDFSSEIAAYDELISRYWSEDKSKWLMLEVSFAARMKVASLAEREEYTLALAAAEAWLELLERPAFYRLAYQRAYASFEKAVLLGKLARTSEAIAVYEEVIREFGDATSPDLRYTSAKCLFNLAWTHDDLGHHDKEMDTYRDLIRRYAADSDIRMKVEVAMAYVNLGYCLAEASNIDDAVMHYDWVIARYAASKDADLRAQAEKARTNRENALNP